MRKYAAAGWFLLWMLAQFVGTPTVDAAPGDFLFLWGSQQHFIRSSGIAADGNGNVFVTDIDKVHVFNSSGTLVKKIGSYGSGDGQLSYPSGIAVDGTGRVYVADTGNERVEVFNGSGEFLGKWTHPDWATSPPVALASDGRGKIYVLESEPSSVVKIFDSSGNFLKQLPGIGRHLAVDTDGNVYMVDDYGVQVYNADGKFMKTAVEGSIHGVAVDQSRNVYVIRFNGWDSPVDVIDSAGQFVRTLYDNDGGSLFREWYWHAGLVAVDGKGNVYMVSETGLSVFDSAGNQSRDWWARGAWPGQLSRPQGIAVDSTGKVYETDSYDSGWYILNNRVQIFSGDGKSLGKWDINVRQTSGITVDDSDKVYVLQGFNFDDGTSYPGSEGHVYDSSGNFLRELGQLIPCNFENGQCSQPYGIAIDKSGNAVVTGAFPAPVSVYDSAGKYLRSIESPNGFATPKGVTVDQQGNIYVSDSGNSRVQVFDSAYNFIRKWGSPGSGDGQFSAPAGMAVDGGGRVFVVDTGNNRVQVFDSSGSFLRKWGGKGDDNGLFSAPEGIALNRDGTKVYVADTGNNRIQAFEGYPASTYSVSGTVRQGSATGPFLPGATVAIAGKTATTNSTGTFSINGIAPGTYTLTISKAGYATKTVTGLVVNGNIIDAWYYLFPAYSLSGTVRQGSATGPFLAGATVAIAGKTATTSSTGTFTITGIAPGTYTLTISKAGYATKTVTGLVVNGNMDGAWYYLFPAYSLSGTVRQGSATGPVLAGATVAIAGKTATTSSTGTFSITGIAAGTYTLTLSKSGYATKSVTGYVVNGNRSGLVFYLAPAYTVSGAVRQGSATGPVLAGATVSIAGKTATSSSTGTFSLTGIPAGTYTLTISKSGYVTKSVTGYVVNGNRSGLVFYLVPAYTVSGTVRQGSASGPVLPGATVSIAGKSATTSSTGTFSIAGIPAGTYTVTISKIGYVTKTITGYVINVNKTGVTFFLTR